MISLKSKITIRILNYYFLNPDAGYYINELARILEVDPKNLDRKLKELERDGVLKSEFSGKQRYFYLAKGPLIKHYRRLILSTVGLEGQLREAFQKIKGLQTAYIFGSYAKNKMEAGSDIDVLAIGKHSVLELQKNINVIQKRCGREINAVNMTNQEFEKKKKANNPLLKQIFSGKIIKIA